MRTFDTGATRDTTEGKLDIHRFLDRKVLLRYCGYLNDHRMQSDGQLREPDNYKKGIGQDVYMASMTRHFFSVWGGFEEGKIDQDELCALMFNVMGMLFEEMRDGRD